MAAALKKFIKSVWYFLIKQQVSIEFRLNEKTFYKTAISGTILFQAPAEYIFSKGVEQYDKSLNMFKKNKH